ncbi:MAG: DUF4428 domain-containing protein [Clostridia bacterium]|nr:DUF4428 domain-containing protein [Clostridia bacterium]
MGLFDKKSCDICNGKIGLLGNRKLEDGNLCKDCARLLSPFFSDRRRSTVSDIQEQLAYREANKAAVTTFHTTRTLGKGTKVLLDEDARKFIVTAARKLEDENPDVLDYSQVTGCQIDVEDSRTEQKQKSSDGKEVSYTPPRYVYYYDFYVTIHVNHPWFNEIRFKLNNQQIKSAETSGSSEIGRRSNDYRECEALAEEIKEALTQVRQTARDNIIAAGTPKTAQICPLCGATTVPDAQGRCEFCDGAITQ